MIVLKLLNKVKSANGDYMKKRARNNVKISNLFILFTFVFFVAIIFRTAQLIFSDNIDGHDLSFIASQRTTRTDIITASRGTIYTSNGEVLAQNVSSYTLIAYLSESRSEGLNGYYHVVDKQLTATELSPILGMPVEDILNLLMKENVYQTEFGLYGKNLTELEKETIENLNLPGLDFIETQKRYYPNGTFASYTVGYSKNTSVENEDGIVEDKIIGEMGIEKEYNDILEGQNGYITYQKDLNGYHISGTPITQVDPVYGKDVYLTIDSNIQFFVEQALIDSFDNYGYEWMTMMVADAKTGEILASGSAPSFDPNIRDITNYLDYNTALPYEPGSTMKIYSYMAAMETGLYEGSQTYLSGQYETLDGTIISDWNKKGWGYISYNQGFLYSSNVATINLVNEYMSGDILYDYYRKLGFGSPTGVALPNEAAGSIDFFYETEIYNAAFGQGVLTTPIQNIQALTSISNNGMLLEPYIIDKIVDPNTNEIVFEGERQEIEKVASQDTTEKIKQLMYDNIHVDGSTGVLYKIDGFDIIGKTGTAQIASENGSGYLSGTDEVIVSFAGMYPKDDPEIIIYASAKRPTNANQKAVSTAVTNVIENINKYYGNDYNDSVGKSETIIMESYVNSFSIDELRDLASENENIVILGDGTKVINQFPSQGTQINGDDKIYLMTNSSNIIIPDFSDFSLKDVKTFCSFMELECIINGTGYVTNQNILANTFINLNETISLEFSLSTKY